MGARGFWNLFWKEEAEERAAHARSPQQPGNDTAASTSGIDASQPSSSLSGSRVRHAETEQDAELMKVMCTQKDQAALLQVRGAPPCVSPWWSANPGPEPKRAESTRELEWRVLGISRESSRLQLTRILGSSLPGRLNGRLPVSPGTRPTQLVVQAYSSSRVRTMRAFLIRWWTRASHTGGATLRGSFWGGGELGEGARGKSG